MTNIDTLLKTNRVEGSNKERQQVIFEDLYGAGWDNVTAALGDGRVDYALDYLYLLIRLTEEAQTLSNQEKEAHILKAQSVINEIMEIMEEV